MYELFLVLYLIPRKCEIKEAVCLFLPSPLVFLEPRHFQGTNLRSCDLSTLNQLFNLHHNWSICHLPWWGRSHLICIFLAKSLTALLNHHCGKLFIRPLHGRRKMDKFSDINISKICREWNLKKKKKFYPWHLCFCPNGILDFSYSLKWIVNRM